MYKDAALLISQHECDPYFLLQLFRTGSRLDSSYSRQKVLMAIDAVLAEQLDHQQELTPSQAGSSMMRAVNVSPRLIVRLIDPKPEGPRFIELVS